MSRCSCHETSLCEQCCSCTEEDNDLLKRVNNGLNLSYEHACETIEALRVELEEAVSQGMAISAYCEVLKSRLVEADEVIAAYAVSYYGCVGDTCLCEEIGCGKARAYLEKYGNPGSKS